MSNDKPEAPLHFWAHADIEIHTQGILPKEDVLRNLKLSLLLYDTLVLSTPNVLASSVFYDLMQQEPETVGQLYRDGVLQFTLDRNDIVAVGEAMSSPERQSVIDLNSYDDLNAHAAFIAGFDPRYVKYNEDTYRDQFTKNMIAMMAGEVEAQQEDWSQRALEWLKSPANQPLFNSEFHRFMDSNVTPEEALRAKVLAECCYQATMTQSLAENQPVNLLTTASCIDVVKRVQPDHDFAITDDAQKAASERDMIGQSILPRLVDLPLETIVLLRDESEFVALRESLAALHENGQDVADVSTCLDGIKKRYSKTAEYVRLPEDDRAPDLSTIFLKVGRSSR